MMALHVRRARQRRENERKKSIAQRKRKNAKNNDICIPWNDVWNYESDDEWYNSTTYENDHKPVKLLKKKPEIMTYNKHPNILLTILCGLYVIIFVCILIVLVTSINRLTK